jgi:hypothetical protein
MADCKYTCFDRVLNLVGSCPKDKLEELYSIITYDGLNEILDFGVENDCFTQAQSQTLYEGIIMWEDLDGNYYEEDPDKMEALLSAMGVIPSEIHKWQEEHEEDEAIPFR